MHSSSSPPPANDDADGNTLWPPGTVLLENMRAAAGPDLVLNPRPSRDPNDPLNWPTWRKYVNMGMVCFYVAMIGQFINATTPTWDPMEVELGYTDEILNDSFAAGCAALGIGSLLMIPFALKYGRRPLYLLSTVVSFGVSIWSARMQTVADLMAINVVQCLFGSLAEAIVQMTIADVFFVHQRGRMNTLYVWVWMLSSYMGSFIAGFVTSGMGWRWVWWWNVIIFGAAIFMVAFGYEETKFIPPPAEPEVPGDVSGTALPGVAKNDDDKTAPAPDAVDFMSIPAVEANMRVLDLGPVTIDPSIPRKTYWQRLALFTTTSTTDESNATFLRHMYQPLILLGTIPIVAYTSLVYGILVGLGDVMSTTLSTYLPKAPYGFTSDQVGLMSLPRMIGVTLGALAVGPISDWWIVYMARRRGGVYDPEVRLWCVVPFLVLVPAGALLFGFGLDGGLPWPVVAVGLVLYNAGVTPINSIMVTYLTDSYKDVSFAPLILPLSQPNPARPGSEY